MPALVMPPEMSPLATRMAVPVPTIVAELEFVMSPVMSEPVPVTMIPLSATALFAPLTPITPKPLLVIAPIVLLSVVELPTTMATSLPKMVPVLAIPPEMLAFIPTETPSS